MDFQNYTPFAGMAWESWDSNGDKFISSLLRLKFKLIQIENSSEWRLQLLPEQGDLFGADVFYDEKKMGSVLYESDYVSFKPCADIVVNAKAIAPNDEASKSWSCGVSLYSKSEEKLNSLDLRVKGSMHYGVRESVKEVAIRYELSKGGTLGIKEDEEGKKIATKVDLYNHIGCGNYPNYEDDLPCSEQIFYADGLNIKAPPGFGFIHRSWKSRLDLAGTYDDNWIKNQHPLPPHDFTYLHNQASHPMLMAKDYIEAGSKIELRNLIKESSIAYFTIPEFKLLSRLKTQTDSRWEVLMLDTLVIDLESEDDYIVYASYRAYTAFYDQVVSAELMLIEEA